MINFKHVFAFGLVAVCLGTNQMQAGPFGQGSAFTPLQSPSASSPNRSVLTPQSRSLTPAGNELFESGLSGSLKKTLDSYRKKEITKTTALKAMEEIETELQSYLVTLSNSLMGYTLKGKQTRGDNRETEEIHTQILRIYGVQSECLSFLHGLNEHDEDTAQV
jgi:hypothetical protein